MRSIAAHSRVPSASSPAGLLDKLNGPWHERALQLYMVVVLAHWVEHLVQAFQIYGLGWPVPASRGVLGHFYPWLVQSELLHYAYALVMLVGLWIFRRGFTGSDRGWWMLAFWIQFWHHIEHGLLQAQALLGVHLMGSPVPISIAQIWVPRVELHLFYNTIVFLPMIVAMYKHMFPSTADAGRQSCTCAWRPGPLAVSAE
ncbi:MAG TPA: hypothetical protein VHQ65_08915 [Thermoanaerobaculia bacterium]|nr:hypothetical protein [Thermoanaerobaculia bacterium]